MARYKAIIILDEFRTTCCDCPLCATDDTCKLLEEDENINSWDEQLRACPLVKLESE